MRGIRGMPVVEGIYDEGHSANERYHRDTQSLARVAMVHLQTTRPGDYLTSAVRVMTCGGPTVGVKVR
jgi:hypothetical protein